MVVGYRIFMLSLSEINDANTIENCSYSINIGNRDNNNDRHWFGRCILYGIAFSNGRNPDNPIIGLHFL